MTRTISPTPAFPGVNDDHRIRETLDRLGLGLDESIPSDRLELLSHFARVAVGHAYHELVAGNTAAATHALDPVLELRVLCEDDRFRTVMAVALFVRGQVYEAMSRSHEAWTEYAEVLRYEPNHPEANRALWRLAEEFAWD